MPQRDNNTARRFSFLSLALRKLMSLVFVAGFHTHNAADGQRAIATALHTIHLIKPTHGPMRSKCNAARTARRRTKWQQNHCIQMAIENKKRNMCFRRAQNSKEFFAKHNGLVSSAIVVARVLHFFFFGFCFSLCLVTVP